MLKKNKNIIYTIYLCTIKSNPGHSRAFTGGLMKKYIGIIEKEIRKKLLTSEYLISLAKRGFSNELILKEQLLNQKECIELLAEKIDSLYKALAEEEDRDSLDRLA